MKWEKYLVISAILLSLIAGLYTQYKTDFKPSVNDEKYNVILIAVNNMRADHLGVYGYWRNTSQNIDSFAENAIIFENAIAQTPVTLSSTVSLISSLYANSHGVTNRTNGLNDSTLTLQKILKDNGYLTASFITQATNFKYFTGDMDILTTTHLVKEQLGIEELAFVKSLEWLKNNNREPFFLVLSTFFLHFPYVVPEPFYKKFDSNYTGDIIGSDEEFLKEFYKGYENDTQTDIFAQSEKFQKSQINESDYRDISHLIALYDSEINYIDNELKLIFNELSNLNITDRTIIVFLSVDGIGLYEHGGYSPTQLYDENIRVPLVIKHPKISPKKINSQVQLIDVAPTILDFLNIPIPEQFQGKTLLPLIKSVAPKNFNQYVFSESFYNTAYIRIIRTLEWKLLVHANKELYNLIDDPKEKNNLINEYPKIARELETKLLEFSLSTK